MLFRKRICGCITRPLSNSIFRKASAKGSCAAPAPAASPQAVSECTARPRAAISIASPCVRPAISAGGLPSQGELYAGCFRRLVRRANTLSSGSASAAPIPIIAVRINAHGPTARSGVGCGPGSPKFLFREDMTALGIPFRALVRDSPRYRGETSAKP